MNGQATTLAAEGWLTGRQVRCRLDGRISARQLDYWVSTGRIAPEGGRRGDGSGFYWAWSERDVERLRLITDRLDAIDDQWRAFQDGTWWAETEATSNGGGT